MRCLNNTVCTYLLTKLSQSYRVYYVRYGVHSHILTVCGTHRAIGTPLGSVICPFYLVLGHPHEGRHGG